MWLHFILENAHFAVNVMAALMFFAVFWLYYDAWTQARRPADTIKLVGYFLLSISFLVHAAHIETSILETSLLGADINRLLLALTRLPGYACLIVSLVMDPLQPQPKHYKSKLAGAMLVLPGAMAPVLGMSQVLEPILAVIVAFLYLRRSTVGLENHLKPVAASFFILSFAHVLSLASLFHETAEVDIFNLVAPFGPIWVLEHLMVLVSLLVLRKWVFGYLLKQFHTQLFMIFTTTIIVIFLITTVSFTGLLLKNIQDEALRQVETDAKVLTLAIDSKKAEALSDAQVLAQNPQVIEAVAEGARGVLPDLTAQFLLTKKQSTLVVVNDNGKVLARGEDRDKIGDSLSDDPLVKRALLGEAATSIVSKDGVLAPELSARGAAPIKSGGEIVGAVMAGSVIDTAFVDGIKKATGLEASVYGDNVLSATTLVSEDGKSRLIGIHEEHAVVKDVVLTRGQSHSGSVTLVGIPYFSSHQPLVDVDTNPVGMVFVGRPQSTVLAAAGRSIELTFLVTVALLALSVAPAYGVSKYIADQL